MALQEKIEAIGVDVVVKIIYNRLDWEDLEIQIAVELFVQETEFASNLLLKNSE
jgi:hypothetical protein